MTVKDWTGNGNSIYKTLGASSHAGGERELNDYYATDPIAIDKLLTVETPHHHIWECACGGGHLSKRLTEKGYTVVSTDIVDRGYCDFNLTMDFLAQTSGPWGFDYDILTNPPYKYAKEFVLKALELLCDGCRCYMFLKLTFLEGKARYNELFSKFPPKCVYVFSERVLCAKNAEFQRMKDGGGSAVAYAWYVWEKGYKGDTVLKFIEGGNKPMAKQYCRYCANCVLVDEDVCYCENSKKTFTGAKAKSVNQCKSFVFNELDVFNIGRKYKPIEGRKSPQRKSDNGEQISLFTEGKS